MRFLSLSAIAFGPFKDKKLTFAPGINVVYGPNEAGKSSLHAALYAGLCGLRRGPGQNKEEASFAERHKPWDDAKWEVAATVLLEDGRTVELRHELKRRVDCKATDVTTGVNVSKEIMNQNTPDGAKWLGLDRQAFLATACIRQADILGIGESAKTLEKFIQQAATSHTGDVTVAEAIKRINDFHGQNVGSDHAPTKPLRVAKHRLAQAEDSLTKAQAARLDLDALAKEVDDHHRRLVAAQAELALVEAKVAERDATNCAQRLLQATELHHRYPDDPPPSPTADDELARSVAAAIDGWKNRPEVPRLTGETSEEIQRKLDALPDAPEGDRAVDSGISQAHGEYVRAITLLENHRGERPNDVVMPSDGGRTPEELRDLARELETPLPEIDPTLQKRLSQARQRNGALAKQSFPPAALAAAVVLALVAIAGVALGVLVLTVVGGLAAIGTIVWALQTSYAARLSAINDLHQAEAEAAGQQQVSDTAEKIRRNARGEAASRGLPADPRALRALADQLSRAQAARVSLEQWQRQIEELSGQVSEAQAGLVKVLSSRGVPDAAANVEAALKRYRRECDERAEQAREAGKRPLLEDQLNNRLAAEKNAREAQKRRQAIEATLHDVASWCNVSGETDQDLIVGLEMWLNERQRERQAWQQAIIEYNQLERLLDGRSLADLEAETHKRHTEAAARASKVVAEQLAAVVLQPDVVGQIDCLRRAVGDAESVYQNQLGKLEADEQRLPNLAEAEEALQAAQDQLQRVKELGDALTLTRDFLQIAEDQVHRDIAPRLLKSVRQWLPAVTANRYHEVAVDSQTLKVSVRGDVDGTLRDANLLSHGTAEQIYLLLRLAMVEHLTKAGEVCPLILDDVTVQFDRERTEAVLRCLHVISRVHQVILFTQEDDVLAWAEQNLKRESGQDHLERLGAAVPIG